MGDRQDELYPAVVGPPDQIGPEVFPPTEQVNHPSHYGGDTTYETIKVLRAWLTAEEYRGFLKGNAIKYLSRAGKKGEAATDHAKAKWYQDELDRFDKERR